MIEKKAECPHLWEGDEYGTECCALCGATVERDQVKRDGRGCKVVLLVSALFMGCGGDRFAARASYGEGDAQPSLAAGSGGAHTIGASGGASAVGGRAATGGASATGGVATGGTVATGGVAATGGGSAMGGASSGGLGGTSGIGGVTGTSGASSGGSAGASDDGGVVDACTLVTHNNGFGQTWQDCVPLGTHNASQAMKACEAYTAVSCPSGHCILPVGACTDGNNSSEYTGDCGNGNILWTYAAGYQSSGIGHVANTVCPTAQDPSWG